MSTLPPLDEMYRALLRRDAAYDGLFIVAVKTTGIFCRPICPARKPKQRNVEFFATPRDALHAGYRPCRRCRPMNGPGQPPRWVRGLLETVDHAPAQRLTDCDLRRMDIEPARARRYFKEHYGMTFHAYHRARRMGLALGALRNGSGPEAVAHDHGYESPSGFRDAFARLFGQPPGGASNVRCLTARWLDSPLGAMLAVADDDGVCLLEFVDRRALARQIATLRRRLEAVIVPGDHELLNQLADELREYFAGERVEFTAPLNLPGTTFQQDVWRALGDIPPGETLSYAELAERVDRPGAQRAVGRANGDNRLAILVPCHRVVRSDGALCGYGGGLWRKKWLLDHEQARTN